MAAIKDSTRLNEADNEINIPTFSLELLK